MGFLKKWKKKKRREKEARKRLLNNFSFKHPDKSTAMSQDEEIVQVDEDAPAVEHSDKIPMEEQIEEIKATMVTIPEEAKKEEVSNSNETSVNNQINE